MFVNNDYAESSTLINILLERFDYIRYLGLFISIRVKWNVVME